MYVVALGLSVLCFLAVLAYFWRSEAFSLFHPLAIYCGFHGLVFVIRPIFAYIYDYNNLYFAFGFAPSDSDKLTVIFASNLGFLVFSFFCLRSGSAPMEFRQTAANQEERRRLTPMFLWVLAICGPFAVYSLSRNYSSTNNIFEGLTLDRATGFMINTTSNGYVSDMQLMAVSLCALVVWLARFKLIAFLPLIAFVILRAGTGGRGSFISAIASTGLFYLYEKKMRYPGLRLVLVGCLAVLMFTMIGEDRGAGLRQAVGFEETSGFKQKKENQQRPLESMDYANMEFFEYLVYAIPQRTHTYGYFLDNFQIFTEPVPRVLWQNKPVGEPFRRFYLMDYGYPIGMTRSLPGEGWYALGWLGVAIWCGLWGHLLGVLYSRFARSSQSTFQTAYYLVFLPTLIVAFRDGTLITLAKQTGVFFTPLVVWWLLAKYAGIPNARELTASLMNRKHRLIALADNAEPRDLAAGAPARGNTTMLPPAVQRRRAALNAAGLITPPE